MTTECTDCSAPATTGGFCSACAAEYLPADLMIGYTAVMGCLICGEPLEHVTAHVLDPRRARASAECSSCGTAHGIDVHLRVIA